MPDAPVLDAPPPAAPPAAPINNTPYWQDLIGSDGTINHKSLERLPDHLKDVAPLLQNRKTMDDALMGWKQANTLASKKALAPLAPNAPPEVLAERKALLDGLNGVPKEAKDYAIAKPKDLPDAAWHQGLADGFAKWAQENSVSPAAAQKLMSLNLGFVQEQIKAQAANETAFWGEQQKAFDARIKTENIAGDRAAALIEKGIVAMGLDPANPQTAIWLKGSDARYVLMKHAMAIGEDAALTGNEGTGSGGKDYATEARSILSDKANPLNGPYWNQGNKYSRSDHDAAVSRYLELMKLDAAKNAVQDRRR